MTRRSSPVFVVLFALVIVVSGSARQAPRTDAGSPLSWADKRHGWMVDPGSDGRWRCTPTINFQRVAAAGTAVCATDDGGRHWRPIFEWKGAPIISVLRWSGSAGLVAVQGGEFAPWHNEFWTRDSGKHWYPTSAFRGGLTRFCNYDTMANGQSCGWTVVFQQPKRSVLQYVLRVVTNHIGSDWHGSWISEVRTYRVVRGWIPRGHVPCRDWGLSSAVPGRGRLICLEEFPGDSGIKSQLIRTRPVTPPYPSLRGAWQVGRAERGGYDEARNATVRQDGHRRLDRQDRV
jgi:hypothetical protein